MAVPGANFGGKRMGSNGLIVEGNAFISCITSAFSFSKYCMSLLCDNFGNKFAMNE